MVNRKCDCILEELAELWDRKGLTDAEKLMRLEAFSKNTTYNKKIKELTDMSFYEYLVDRLKRDWSVTNIVADIKCMTGSAWLRWTTIQYHVRKLRIIGLVE